MPNFHCPVGVCNNDSRYKEKMEVHSNVPDGIIKFHKCPRDRIKEWTNAISKGREKFTAPKDFRICSNHFVDGKPTPEHPNPTLFLTPSMNSQRTPVKRKRRELPQRKIKLTPSYQIHEHDYVISDIHSEVGTSTSGSVFETSAQEVPLSDTFADVSLEGNLDEDMSLAQTSLVDASTQTNDFIPVPNFPLHFVQVTRESDVLTFTGLQGTEMFKLIFEYLKPKAKAMTY